MVVETAASCALATAVERRHLLQQVAGAAAHEEPYPWWSLHDLLTPRLARAAQAACAPDLVSRPVHDGTRAGDGARRHFIDPALRASIGALGRLAHLFQAPDSVAALAALTGASLAGTFLRCELCCDGPGFWLAPHTDIGAKALTLLVYLSEGPGAEQWGTDIFCGPVQWFARPPAPFNSALLFVPSANSWHGYGLRRMSAWRRTLIVNYVTPQWRNRDELAYPEQPVQA